MKVYSEVNAFSAKESRELKVIADRVSAAALVVSQRSQYMLEDDTVYSRYSVFVVMPKALRNVAEHTAFPLIMQTQEATR